MTPEEAHRIAYIAHGAKKQMRADGKTHYIEHPRRVAFLTNLFAVYDPLPVDEQAAEDRIVAAYLHDVVEDTKITGEDLLYLGATSRQCELVLLLTKQGQQHDPESEEYYRGIEGDDDALVIKCADNCSNLEDALAEVLLLEPKQPRRWAKYVDKSVRQILPMYVAYGDLLHELKMRVDAINEALPASLERRQAMQP